MAAKVRRIRTDQQDCQSPYLIFPVFTAARFYVGEFYVSAAMRKISILMWHYLLAYSKALNADVPGSLHALAFNLHVWGNRWPLARRYETIIRTAVGEHRSPISQCVLPVEFYDLRYSTLEITDLLQVTAEKLGPYEGGAMGETGSGMVVE